ncbi:MAG: hypothetical protein U0168_08125 [Nannocystaceae bacterium]
MTSPPLAARPRLLLAALLGLLTTAALARGHLDVGYVRDEGIYFDASRHYARWAAALVQQPAQALTAAERDRWFRINHEHPALLKLLAGISARVLAQPPQPGTAIEGVEPPSPPGGVVPLLPEGAAMRLPAQLLAGVGVALLFATAAASGGALAGLVAAGAFMLLPHVWFHAGLHAFDVPVAVALLAVVLAYRRAQGSRRWGVAVGVILGLAIAVKHNALFAGPLLALHHIATLAHARIRHHRAVSWGQWLPLPLWSMAIVAPLVAFALWPWLWSDPVARVTEYFAFHRQHAYYNMEFLGANYNQPPMPIAYPFVLTWASVPTTVLVLALVGLGLSLRDDLAPLCRVLPPADAAAPRASFWTPRPAGWSRGDGLLWLIMGSFPLVLIALPSTPIFGGTKHWITAYPFLALAAAHAFATLVHRPLAPRWLPPVLAIACLAPGAISTYDGHPFGMSQYAPLVGGARGAASIGLGRGFWGHAIARELPALPREVGGTARLYVHDMHELAVLQYRREGRWPEGAESVALTRAQSGLLFHELHMATWEYQLWEQLGETAPRHVVELDGVPLTSIYGPPPR